MITLIAVGRVRGPLEAAVRAYEDRLRHYWKFDLVEVEAGTGRGGSPDPVQVMAAEGTRILARVPPGQELWILTREGRPLDSPGLARLLDERRLHALPPVALAIGGAFGFSPEVEARAVQTLSLSAMTLPHELARLVLVEQLYRAGTILRGEPYHKGAR